MFITQLVIEGFKSYKEKVCIKFDPGLNVVLGKNGAGKSNVFAAIEFVLSNKYGSLRSEDRQRLLHEGTSSGGAQQLAAEVEITFDNTDRRFPDDKDVVTLKRVIGLKKDEFLLNNRHVSKTQVDNLLESAGFSRSNPYNIVQQGKVNSLLKMTDAARLELLKEIAGTRVYDKRRAESLKIMHDTDQCRSQIAEISESLETRLQELEDEQEELRQFQTLDKQRRSLEYTIFSLEQNSAERKLANLDADRDNANQAAEESHAEYEKIKQSQASVAAELSEVQVKLAHLEKDQQSIALRRQEAVKKVSHQAILVQTNAELLEKKNARAVEIKSEIESLKARISSTESDLQSVKTSFEEKRSLEQIAESNLEKVKSSLEILYAKQGRTKQFRTRSQRDSYLAKELERLSEMISVEESQSAQATNGISSGEQKMSTLVLRRDEILSEIDVKIAELKSQTQKLSDLKQDRDQRTNERKELWRQEAHNQSNMTELKAKLQRCESSLYGSMPRDVRVGLQSVKDACIQNDISGVHGMLCELFTTTSTFYQAVQTTAGNRLFHIVVDTDETASRILEAMRRNRSGRVTFMPLNRINSSPNNSYVESADAIPMIQKLVFKAIFRPAMSQVFGKTVVVRNLDVGASYSRDHGMNAITLDGDQVNKKGAMTGGFIDSRSSALKTMAELQSVRCSFEEAANIENIRQQARVKDQEVTSILGEMQKCEFQRRQLREQIATLKDELEACQSEISLLTCEIQAKQQSFEIHSTNSVQLALQIESHNQEMASEFRNDLTDEEQQLLESLTEQIPALTKEVLQAADQRAVVQAELSILEDLLALNLRVRLRDLTDSLSTAAMVTDDMSDAIADLKTLQDEKSVVDREFEQNQNEIEQLKSDLQRCSAEVESLKQAEAEIADSVELHSRRMEKLANRRSLLLQKKDDCVRNIRQLGSLPSQAFETYGGNSISKLMSMLKSCNAELKKYSHVNKKAIDQFVAFTEQRALLRERKEELNRGKQAIEECISRLDHQKDEAIRRTFKSIAKNFSKVFSELVIGGKATLVIHNSQESNDDEDEMVDPVIQNPTAATDRYVGIGIKVSFAGEGAVFSMSQLSGGQQTVVALSLIFAIQRCDPFPFYLFDEIDSNLDSAHRASIAQMIARRSQEGSERPEADDANLSDSDVEGEDAVSKNSKGANHQTQFICTTFRPEMLDFAHQHFGVYYTNKVSQVQAIDSEEAHSILDSNEREIEAGPERF